MATDLDDTPRSHLDEELERLRALVQAAQLVHSSLDLDELLDNILSAATSHVGATRGTVYVCDEDRRELWSRVTAGGERLEIRLPYGQGLAGSVAETGKSLRVDDVRRHPLFDPAVDRRTGFTTENALCVPIRDRDGRSVAVLQLLNKPSGFDDADAEFLERMGTHVAQALANAQAQQLLRERERLLKELELAKQIQELLLPSQLPSLPGIGLAARMVSSRQVGGDYYDVVPLRDGRKLLVLADVSGKGVAAALVMSNLQAALWAVADLGMDLARLAAHLNDILFNRLEGNRYVTAVLVQLAANGRSGSYVNAGHPPALLQGQDRIERLESTGPPLGMLPERSYEVGELKLEVGSTLLLYSDGLSEAADAAGEELGVGGLERLLRRVSGQSVEEAAGSLLDAVEEHGQDGSDRDDRTLILLRHLAAPEQPQA
jgi:serine phosphatase RsbU (regulator of sigma subunit)